MSLVGMSFNTLMVQTILAGGKTQTRRISSRSPVAVGDTIYVRETCFVGPVGVWGGPYTANPSDSSEACYFKAGGSVPMPHGVRWRQSFYMPRWAARIFLAVTDVRQQRLRDITAADAHYEGITVNPGEHPVDAFRELWDSIYQKDGLRWDSNPLVWRVEFRIGASHA